MIFTKRTSPAAALSNIQSFLDNTRGQITIGEILQSDGPPWQPRVRRRASPSWPRTRKQSISYCSDWMLLWEKAMAEDTVIDEVLPEIKYRRSR